MSRSRGRALQSVVPNSIGGASRLAGIANAVTRMHSARRGGMAGSRVAAPPSDRPRRMHPALSVIFFTTLSGAGYGLLVWLRLSHRCCIARHHAPTHASLLLVALALGLVLSTIGLLSSLLHLGKPQRAWRAFSQWRTSWLSREGVLAMADLRAGAGHRR